jgi:hypothetical protein
MTDDETRAPKRADAQRNEQDLLDAAARAKEIRTDVDAYALLRGIGNLCIGAEDDPRYDPHVMIDLLLTGLRRRAGD